MPFSAELIDIIEKIQNSPVIRVVINAGPGFGDQAASKQLLDHLLATIKTITNQDFSNKIEIIYDPAAKTQIETLFGVSQIDADYWINTQVRLTTKPYFHTHHEQFKQTFLGITGAINVKKATEGKYKTDFFIGFSPYLGERGENYAIWSNGNTKQIISAAPQSTIRFPVPSFDDARKFLLTDPGRMAVKNKPAVPSLINAIEQKNIESVWVYGLNAEYFPYINVKYTITNLLLALKKSLLTNKPIAIIISNDLTKTEKNELYQLFNELSTGNLTSTIDQSLLEIAREVGFTVPTILQAVSTSFAEDLKKLNADQMAVIDLGSVPKVVFDVCAANSALLIYEGANNQVLAANANAISRMMHCNPALSVQYNVHELYQLASKLPAAIEQTLLDIERYTCTSTQNLIEDNLPHRTAINALSKFITESRNKTSELRQHLDKVQTAYKDNDRLLTVLNHLSELISIPKLSKLEYNNFISAVKQFDTEKFNSLIASGLNPWYSKNKNQPSPIEWAVNKAFSERNPEYLSVVLHALSLSTKNIYLKEITSFDKDIRTILILYTELLGYANDTHQLTYHNSEHHFELAALFNMTDIFVKAFAPTSFLKEKAASAISTSSNVFLREKYTNFVTDNINLIILSKVSSRSLAEIMQLLERCDNTCDNIDKERLLQSALFNPETEVILYLLGNNIFECQSHVKFNMLFTKNLDENIFNQLFNIYFNINYIPPWTPDLQEKVLKLKNTRLLIKALELGWLHSNSTFDQGRYRNIPALLYPGMPEDAFNYFIEHMTNNTLSLAIHSDYFEVWQKTKVINGQMSMVQALYAAANMTFPASGFRFSNNKNKSISLINISVFNNTNNASLTPKTAPATLDTQTELNSASNLKNSAISFTLGFLEADLKKRGFSTQKIHFVIDMVSLLIQLFNHEGPMLFGFMFLRTFLNATLGKMANTKITTPFAMLLLAIAEKLIDNMSNLIDPTQPYSVNINILSDIVLEVTKQSSISLLSYGLGSATHSLCSSLTSTLWQKCSSIISPTTRENEYLAESNKIKVI